MTETYPLEIFESANEAKKGSFFRAQASSDKKLIRLTPTSLANQEAYVTSRLKAFGIMSDIAAGVLPEDGIELRTPNVKTSDQVSLIVDHAQGISLRRSFMGPDTRSERELHGFLLIPTKTKVTQLKQLLRFVLALNEQRYVYSDMNPESLYVNFTSITVIDPGALEGHQKYQPPSYTKEKPLDPKSLSGSELWSGSDRFTGWSDTIYALFDLSSTKINDHLIPKNIREAANALRSRETGYPKVPSLVDLLDIVDHTSPDEIDHIDHVRENIVSFFDREQIPVRDSTIMKLPDKLVK